MKVSKDFLNDFIEIKDVDFNELAEKMVFAGNEYESITKLTSATNLVVGHVLQCSKHPESKKLSICLVDIGDEKVQILCGAPNVRENIKVIVAKIGATLPGNITIGKAKLAGMESNGMICSLVELGIESKYLKEEDKNGIYILDNNAEAGTDAVQYLGYDDEVIDFELTANRADLLSMLGMAYEVGALYKRNVKYPDTKVVCQGEDINSNYQINVKTDKCSLYTMKLVKNVTIKESPNFIKRRLMASGIRPINNVVDISNYVMMEYGQPLHFFDADKLGNYIEIREANDKEELETLDKNIRVLDRNDIVIADVKKAVALAGVMGGLSTEVTSETKNVLIESAVFDALSIRNTSKKVIRSEASSRFEKGIDTNRTREALERSCYLLNKYADGTVINGMLVYDNTNLETKTIMISLNKINDVLGLDLNKNEVLDVFKRLDFICSFHNHIFEVTVPSRRLDITIKEDLIEEIGRIIGFNNVKGSMPISYIKSGKRSPKDKYQKDIRNRLTALGLNQTLTYSLISELNADLFINEDYEKVVISSPITDDRKVMRNSLVSSLLEVFKYNYARNIKDINIFEIGSCYSKKEDSYLEKTNLCLLMTGTYLSNNWQQINLQIDFYTIKGIIINLLNYLGFDNRYQFNANDSLKDMHQGRSADIVVDHKVIGYFGQINSNLAKTEVYVAQIDLDLLFSLKVRQVKYKDISKYPTITKDVSFIVDEKISSMMIIDVIKKTGGRLLNKIEVFDMYVGNYLADNEKAIAYKLIFSDVSRTLSDEEVMTVFNKIISAVETNLNAHLRQKN
ncbi:MAG: phenylalanine--tRNA ligase subunit beta [Bacilli bacterium]|nr:phenylalanine--tRNA ligase subunit beta [Bacilli bacterium]